MVLNFTPEHSWWDWSCKHLQCHAPQACFSCRNVAQSVFQCIVCILFYWWWGRIPATYKQTEKYRTQEGGGSVNVNLAGSAQPHTAVGSALSEEAWLPACPLVSHRSAALELSRGLGSQARKLFGPEEMGSTGVCPDHSGSSLEVHSYGHLMGTYGRGLSGLSTHGLCIGRWHSELELSCLLHIDQSSGEGPVWGQ